MSSDSPDWSQPATDADIAALGLKVDTVITNTSPINNPLNNTTANMSNVRAIIRTATAKEAIVIYNPSATVTVWVGGSAVTAGNGIPILPGGYHSWAVDTESLYGITAAGAVTVQIAYGVIS